MSNPMMMQDATGMTAPKRKKTRRGKRNRSPIGDPKQHAENVNQALSKGDHATAKQHAFALVRSLHAVTAKPVEEQGEAQPDNESMEGETMGKHWIANAVGKPGALHRELGVPEGEKIPAKKLSEAAASGDETTKRRVALARTLMKMRKR